MSTPRERRRSALILALLLSLMATLVLLSLVRDHLRSGDVRERLLSDVSWKTMHIERRERPAIGLKASGPQTDDWQIVAPCRIATDPARLKPLFDVLGATVARYPSEQVDRAAAGLDAPTIRLQLDDTVLAIGEPDLVGERRYVEADARVGFVPAWIGQLLDGGLSAIGRLSPLPAAIESLELVVDEAGPSAGMHSVVVAPGEAGDTLETWQSLVASQIVDWPISGFEASPQWQARLSVVPIGGDSTVLSVSGYERFVALIPDGGGCAWLVDPSTWPLDAE